MSSLANSRKNAWRVRTWRQRRLYHWNVADWAISLSKPAGSGRGLWLDCIYYLAAVPLAAVSRLEFYTLPLCTAGSSTIKFQLFSLPTTSWYSCPPTRPQDNGRRKGRLTAECVRCFHKFCKSTSVLCAQPQLPTRRQVCPGEGIVCCHTWYTPDPRGEERVIWSDICEVLLKVSLLHRRSFGSSRNLSPKIAWPAQRVTTKKATWREN